MKSAPMMNAWASPSGEGWTAYEMSTPQAEPSSSRRRNWSMSCGVVMTRISRIPAIISVDSG